MDAKNLQLSGGDYIIEEEVEECKPELDPLRYRAKLQLTFETPPVSGSGRPLAAKVTLYMNFEVVRKLIADLNELGNSLD